MKTYYTTAKASKLLGVSPQTLRNWDMSGKLKPSKVNDSGYRYYTERQIREVLGDSMPNRKVVGYCRVEQPSQKEELDKLSDKMELYLMAQGTPFSIIKDIGVVNNFKRDGLSELIELISQDQADKLVLLTKESLLIEGYELVEIIAKAHSCKIEIIKS